MRIKLRNPILSATQDQRYQEYLQDRLTGNNIIQVTSIVVQDPPLVRTAVSRRTYIKSPRDHKASWLVAGAASAILSVVPPTLIERIPALSFKVPNPIGLVDREPEILTINLEIPTTKQVPDQINVPVQRTKEVEIQTRNQAGEFQADPIAIGQTAELIKEIVDAGGTIDSTIFTASASDEWGPLSRSLGVENGGNVKTARDRGDAVVTALSSATSIQGNNLGQIQVNSGEDIWTGDEIENFEALSIGLGFESSQALYDAYKIDRNSVPTGLADYLDVKLGENRGTNILINYTTVELEQRTVLITVPDTIPISIDIPFEQKHDPFDLRVFPIFIPPLGRRNEEREELFPQSHSEDITDQAFIKLFPEAKTLTGKLREDSWRDTRKYDYLLKNDRIKYVHRLDYKDAKGDPQTIRVAFIDHVPSADALLAAVKVAQEAAQVQKGKIGQRLDLIAMFPSQKHEFSDSEELGLGIDQKLPDNVLGLAFPGIGLVEAHYNPNASYEQLTSSGDLVHTLRHEILGHFTDLQDREPRLSKVHNIPNGYTLSTHWEGILTNLYRHHLRLELAGAPKTFDIVRKVDGQQPGQQHSNEGELFERSVVEQVPDDGSVVSVNLRRFTDSYARTDEKEYWAQSVAYALAEVSVAPSTTFGSSLLPSEVTSRLGGYRPDRRVIEIVHKELGTLANRDGAAFPLDFQPRPDFQHIGGIESDSEFQGFVDQAKDRVLPKESDLLNVVTTVRPLRSISPHIEPVTTQTSGIEIASPVTDSALSR